MNRTFIAITEADLQRIKLTTERSSDGWVQVTAELPRSKGNPNNGIGGKVSVPR